MNASSLSTAPVLSTPDDHILQEPVSVHETAAFPELSNDGLYKIYEVDRTVQEIIQGGWRTIALQFPDDMLRDAPRVFDALQDRLNHPGRDSQDSRQADKTDVASLQSSLATLLLTGGQGSEDRARKPFKLTILADTSYGSCCVDEIAAEHVDAEVVVHYGRTCLSPTARLPVIYVFTLKSLDMDQVMVAFSQVLPNKQTPVLLLADVPYHGHVSDLESRLLSVGYSSLFAPSIVHDPASLIPNRTVPPEAQGRLQGLQQYSIFHISDPPQSLLLNISSRVSSIFIYPTAKSTEGPSHAIEASTAQALRRRYALVTRLSTVPIFGILINTLSVKNYMDVLQHVKDLIAQAGKKYYTFVVGKVNAAKVANFSEVGGWVVIGCWESSLIESKDFWKPIITPYELKIALTDEKDRLWTGEWNSNFQALLDDNKSAIDETHEKPNDSTDGLMGTRLDDLEQSDDESEPPVFDLRTGRYVSQSRPMAQPRSTQRQNSATANATTSTSLIKRDGGHELARVGDQVSPAAEYLRSQRTWQGLGSDADIAYQFDDEGRVQGAQIEEGRSGVARGYRVGEDESKT